MSEDDSVKTTSMEEWKMMRGRLILQDAIYAFKAQEGEIPKEVAEKASRMIRAQLNEVDSMGVVLGFVEDGEIITESSNVVGNKKSKAKTWLKQKLTGKK